MATFYLKQFLKVSTGHLHEKYLGGVLKSTLLKIQSPGPQPYSVRLSREVAFTFLLNQLSHYFLCA